jgi:hypothetical protein
MRESFWFLVSSFGFVEAEGFKKQSMIFGFRADTGAGNVKPPANPG